MNKHRYALSAAAVVVAGSYSLPFYWDGSGMYSDFATHVARAIQVTAAREVQLAHVYPRNPPRFVQTGHELITTTCRASNSSCAPSPFALEVKSEIIHRLCTFDSSTS
jgi:hypothetical protein